MEENATVINQNRTKFNGKKVFRQILTIFAILTIIIFLFIKSEVKYRNETNKLKNTINKQKFWIELASDRLEKGIELSDFEKSNNIILEICGANWELTQKTPREIECLRFYSWGKIEKTINGLLVSSNDNITDPERAKIAVEVNYFFDELQNDGYEKWLLKDKIAVAGGVIDSIKTYSYSKSVKPISQRAMVTTYAWGIDYSAESRRLMEIFDKLKTYSSSVNSTF